MIFLFDLIFCAGTFSTNPTEVTATLSNMDISLLTDHKWLAFVIVMPLLTSAALSLLQMTLEFVTKPVFSYGIVVCILVLSGYFFTPFFIGNGSMLLRSEIVLTNGIPFIQVVLLAILLIVLTVVTGYLLIRALNKAGREVISSSSVGWCGLLEWAVSPPENPKWLTIAS